MIFHTFGSRDNSVIVLLHGMLTPWQIWEDAIEHFSKEHFVVVPELDAHTEDKPSSFVSVEEEAEKIRKYLTENFGGEVYALCGLSMGGRIAATVAGMEGLKIRDLVLDGAPLKKLPGILAGIMKKSYISIIAKSKKRDPKVIESCKRDFLPERYHEYFFRIADNMENDSIGRILDSVFSSFTFKPYGKDMNILFMHGTKGNESVSKKCAVKMKAANPQTEIRCYDGYAHARLACFEPKKWVREVSEFLEKSRG